MRLAVVGTGLMGSSFARAARSAGLVRHIVGVEPNRANADAALNAGIVDALAHDVPEDVDVVLIATPSDLVAEWVERLARHTGTLFDVGSVKGAVVQEVERRMGALPENFVPCHPVAGSEKSGPTASRADLFDGCTVVLTPTSATNPGAVEIIAGLWQRLGAQVQQMSPSEHDRVLALTSHLPHFLSMAYMGQVQVQDMSLAGGGFRDFTRIAEADAQLWWRIFRLNQPALLQSLDGLQAEIARLRGWLEAGDETKGVAHLAQIARLRGRFQAGDSHPDADTAPDSLAKTAPKAAPGTSPKTKAPKGL